MPTAAAIHLSRMTPPQVHGSIAFCVLALTAVLIRLILRVRGTTLVAPLVWGCVASLAIGSAEIALAAGNDREGARQLLRYMAAILTCCPPMALLGAKRPQDRGWQFIVGTLWVVLALPAIQPILFARSSQFQLHDAWRGFLLVLIAISVANYLPTRFALAASLAGVAQVLLLLAYLPLVGPPLAPIVNRVIPDASLRALLALGLMLCAACDVTWRMSGARAVAAHKTSHPWDRAWRDFRDAFGVVWALRVMERINQASDADGTRLNWDGFQVRVVAHDDEPDDAALETGIRASLRRFVSEQWIAERLDRD